MKYKVLLSFLAIALIFACQDRSAEQQYEEKDTAAVHNDNPVLPDTSVYNDEHIQDTVDVFSGGRFRNVRVEKIGDSTFELTGEAQVFEAAFSWVIEDGHKQLKQGHGTTDAGAPAWGKFSFQVSASKPEPNGVLHLILFEASAKDGSRQHELPVVLYR